MRELSRHKLNLMMQYREFVTKKKVIMTDNLDSTKYFNENQNQEISKDINIKQEFIKREEIWENTDIMESNCNKLKHKVYKINDLRSPKDNKEIGENREKNEHAIFRDEDGLEVIYIKKEITDEFIPVDTQSEKFIDSNPYFCNGVESVAGTSTVTRNEMGKNFTNNVPFKGEKGLEIMCVNKEITENKIIKDEPYFSQIEIQENTNSDVETNADSNLYFPTETESMVGSIKNNSKLLKREHKRSNDVTDNNVFHCDRSYTCDVCKKMFNRKTDLKRHELIHTGEKPYECDVCGKTFNVKCNLISHKIIHTSDKLYVCDVCKKSFHRKGDFQKHEIIHTGIKPYACDVCEVKFNRKSHLIYHKLIHTGEKPHECDVCGKTFKRKDHLNMHKTYHSSEKPFECDVCEKTYKRKDHLIVHKRYHSGENSYECDVCEKKFAVNGALIQHKRIHTGEKPFTCDICQKQFISVSNLNRHNFIHSGKKPHVCDVCKKTFNQKSHLIKHERLHTDQKT